MSLNKEIIFGLSSLGDDEMLFPDFSRVIYTHSKWVNEWTATEDCFIVAHYYGADGDKPGGLEIDGVAVALPITVSYNDGLVCFSSYVAKGSSLRAIRTEFTAYALKRLFLHLLSARNRCLNITLGRHPRVLLLRSMCLEL